MDVLSLALSVCVCVCEREREREREGGERGGERERERDANVQVITQLFLHMMTFLEISCSRPKPWRGVSFYPDVVIHSAMLTPGL